ncbi:DUF2892 domain-containing protein [Luteimonas aestuarii]|uniref:DUF2892 domain-containing protein n=1 Tax=Luteimonas aestuarii TaxID=453837 RepID=A0A4R5TJ94_9GAMM|nr:DUF2892 domain-containing protein [Luteimonas aestuarii]TDK21506.1 DUF2892 domain-containing protein [Luteimonas aestuarii]
MKANAGRIDKGTRIISGVALPAWAATGGPAWAWIGAVPLATGLFDFCPLYRLVGMDTCRHQEALGGGLACGCVALAGRA